MARVISRFEYERHPGEENDGELLVETAGYIPADVKIESMIDAGRRLISYRQGYEFDESMVIPDDYVDPTRNPNFDLADATILANEAISRSGKNGKKQSSVSQTEDKKAEVETTAEKVNEK